MEVSNKDITALVDAGCMMVEMAYNKDVARMQVYELEFDIFHKVSLRCYATDEVVRLTMGATALVDNCWTIEQSSLLVSKETGYVRSMLASAVTDVLDSLLTTLGYSIS